MNVKIKGRFVPSEKISHILKREVGSSFGSLQNPMESAIRSNMRVGVTQQEVESLRSELSDTLTSVSLRFFDSNQAAKIDELGKAPGSFPPFGPGSELSLWVREKLGVEDEELDHVTFMVARQQFEQGLPRPGDRLNAPFKTTAREFAPEIESRTKSAVHRAVREINHGTSE